MSAAHYMLQVNIYLIVFYGCYRLLLDKETYFTLNRIYLLAAGLLSVAIPFLQFEWFSTQPAAQTLYVGVDQLNNLMTQVIVAPEKPGNYSLGNLLVFIYLAGVLFFAGKLGWQLWTVAKLLRKTAAGTAFSFFTQKRIDHSLPGLPTIDRHEEVHIRQLHSADILLFELLGIFTWFNPVIYGYKHSLKNIHEYLADEAAAAFQGDKKEYALLLLSNTFGIPANTLTNSFFNKSLLKKRIFMLHKQRSGKSAILKYGMFVPLMAIALIMSSASIRNNAQIQQIADEIPLNTPIEVVTEVVKESIRPVAPQPLKKAINEKPVRTLAGWEDFYKFTKRNLRYPVSAQKERIQGTTMLKFTVAGGLLDNIGIVTKLGGGCDVEAMKTLASFSGYKAVNDGKYTINISFHLNGANTPLQNEKIPPIKGYTALHDIVVVAYAGPAIAGSDEEVHSFIAIDTQPVFPGGMTKFYEYLKNNIRYPAEALKNNVQGKVFMSFVVEKDGTLNDFKVERKLGSGTDEEALRVMKESPKWIPGQQNGKPVRVKYNIPIGFSSGKAPRPAVSNITGFRFRDENGAEMKPGDQSSDGPLVILDGKQIDVAEMKLLDPNRIESINVIKDAKATAIYGIKGANGVLLISTKTKNLDEITVKPLKKEK